MPTTWQAVNVNTGTPEKAKYNEIGVVAEIWTLAISASLASGDTISGPVIPMNTWLLDVKTDWDAQGTTITFEAGYSGHLAAFIAAGNTTAQSGGIQAANVAGTVGFTATTDTTVLITLGATPSAPTGHMRISVTYTGNP
jgi:hypothetical protein